MTTLPVLCLRPGCPSPPTLSGFCALHYWQDFAECESARCDSLQARVDVLSACETDLRGIVCALNDAAKNDALTALSEIKVYRPDGSATWLTDRVLEVLRSHAKGGAK